MLGLLDGLAWWLAGALRMMPAWLGMGEMIFQTGEAQWQSFAGHLLYRLLLAVVYVLVVSRAVRR